MANSDAEAWKLARRVAKAYAKLEAVESVAVAGSRATGQAEEDSDIDLYVYTRKDIPIARRAEIAQGEASYAEINNRFWEPGDLWIDRRTKLTVDVAFRSKSWIVDQLSALLDFQRVSVGYSTCLWANVLDSRVLEDRKGWLKGLQRRARVPYPPALRQAVIDKNYPILRDSRTAYLAQITAAHARGDRVTVQHRSTALIASVFDILFAINEIPHPGEKRMLHQAMRRCERLPDRFSEILEEALASTAPAARTSAGSPPDPVAAHARLVDAMETVMVPTALARRQGSA